MDETAEPPICEFYRLIPDAPDPQRADRSAGGTLPVKAYQYCEAVASASGFGWHLYPPLNFGLIWDGREIAWTYEGAKDWFPVRVEPYPDFHERFLQLAPSDMADLMPPFLQQGVLPGLVQIWSGYLVKTRRGWALLSRGMANLALTEPVENHEAIVEGTVERDDEEVTPPYVNYEGIIETTTWFGPLFTNVRLMRINSPVYFHVNRPLMQVQPLLRQCYHEPSFTVREPDALTLEDWGRFEATARRNTNHMRRPGHYAAETRRRLRREDAAT